DAVGGDALADQVVLDGVGAALRQAHVVLLGTDGVGVAGGDQGFQVDRIGLSGDLIQDLTAFGLQRGLVEIEEGVSIEDNFGCGRSNDRRFGLGDRYAVAAGNAGCGGPEVVAPAQFVRAV